MEFRKYQDIWENLKWDFVPVEKANEQIIKGETTEGYLKLMDLIDEGNAIAMYYLAEHYYFGDGVDCDGQKVAEYLDMAATAGLGFAQFLLGEAYESGCYVELNKEEATGWYKKALTTLKEEDKLGNSLSTLLLGRLYSEGKGVKQDHFRSFLYYKKAAESNNIDAKINVCICTIEGIGVKQDKEKGVQQLADIVKDGYIRADYVLGLYYREGDFINKNLDKAIEHLLKAAAHNNRYAQYKLGSFLEAKDIKCRKTDIFIQYLKNSAANNFAEAEYLLGRYYRDGFFVEKDSKESEFYLKLAAEQGNTLAMYYYGELKNSKDSVNYFLKAAQKGHNQSQYKIGEFYLKGTFVEKNIETAIYWLKKSAEKDNVKAIYQLSVLYRDGIGVEKDIELYKSLYSKFQSLATSHDYEYLSNVDETVELEFKGKAAEMGNCNAITWLANNCHQRNNDLFAFKWCKKLYEFGYSGKGLSIGECYEEGIGVEQNMYKAIKYYAEELRNNYSKAIKRHDDIENFFNKKIYHYSEFLLLKKGAIEGDPQSQCRYADYLVEGYGTDKNYKEAIVWYEKAISQNYALAKIKLARCYEEGLGVSIDKEKCNTLIVEANSVVGINNIIEIGRYYINHDDGRALALLTKHKENSKVQYLLGRIYYEGKIVSKDINKAILLLKKSAAKNDVEACFLLGYCYEIGDGVEKDEKKYKSLYTEAESRGFSDDYVNLSYLFYRLKDGEFWFRCLLLAAEKGDVVAQYKVSQDYVGDDAFIEDYVTHSLEGADCDERFLFWCSKAAYNGYANAIFDLGVQYMYNTSLFDTTYDRNAFLCFKRSADLGYGEAQFKMYNHYKDGKFVDKSIEIAYDFLLKSAWGGVPRAQYELAACYEYGKGIEKDEEKAIMWYTIASVFDYDAKLALARCFENGIGTKRNLECMVNLFRRTENYPNWNNKNKFYLGKCYEEGKGVAQDISKAIDLYKESGTKDAEKALKRLGFHMSNS